MLETLFKLREHGTNVKTEVIAGFTTFLTMAYIIFVNPAILSETGMDFKAVFVATCLVAGFGSLLMGLWAKLPMAIGCAMTRLLAGAHFLSDTYGAVLLAFMVTQGVYRLDRRNNHGRGIDFAQE